jgi:tRNA threonylcarbamoyladenosine biosynthesis protein TsaE
MITLNDLRGGILSPTTESTENFGAELVRLLPENSAIALSGDLGSGKTAFARGIARACGIEKTVTSPTYNIYSIYQARLQLIHMDAYRLPNANAIDSLMLEEFLKEPYLIVIEWPERIPAFFNDYPSYFLQFSIQENEMRFIQLYRETND